LSSGITHEMTTRGSRQRTASRIKRARGESSRVGLPSGLCLLPLSPPASVEVSLLVRRYNRSPLVDQILDSAAAISEEFGWI
jgi:hypothetical protein